MTMHAPDMTAVRAPRGNSSLAFPAKFGLMDEAAGKVEDDELNLENAVAFPCFTFSRRCFNVGMR